MKHNSTPSRSPMALYSIIVSFGLLAVLMTFASWILLSSPIGAAVRNYFYGFEDVTDLSSLISSKNTTQSDINSSAKEDKNDGNSQRGADEKKAEGSRRFSNNEEKTPLVDVRQEVNDKRDDVKAPSEVMNNEKEALVSSNSPSSQPSKGDETADAKKRSDDDETEPPMSQDVEKKQMVEKECDLFKGEWYYDQSGPVYSNDSCPIISEVQNCQGNGRPDKGYENWRWRPLGCELPRFDSNKFLDLMQGKSLAFFGDSVARNQMESLLCLLWQVEVPINRGNRHVHRWVFRRKGVAIYRIWSGRLVHTMDEPFKGVPKGVEKVFLDIPDKAIMESISRYDVVVLSSGHWFNKQSIFVTNNEITGTQLWPLSEGQKSSLNNIDAFEISTETILSALVRDPNYSGIIILRAFSPDHYEGGAWNMGGSCTGKTEPARPGQLTQSGFTEMMYERQVKAYYKASMGQTNRAKLRFMDITKGFSYRHDGHPGPYRGPNPKVTTRGPDGRPPPQDCLHWCLPGPVDTWNEMMLEITRREYERQQKR